MTFDEVLDEMNADQEPSESIRFMERLRDIYAPTIEMTKKQYNTFKWHKDNLDFSTCLGTFKKYNGETRIGIKFDNLKGDLSDEDIMQAWLHPETIKIVDE